MSMKKMRKAMMAAMILFGCVCAPVVATGSYGQLVDEKGNKVESDTSKQTTNSGGGFYDIVFGSGIVGMLLWFALFGDGAMAMMVMAMALAGVVYLRRRKAMFGQSTIAKN